MKALILSGGTGTRLRPLTYSNAKQLLPVANKPILFYIIEKIVAAGITDIGIIVGDTHIDIESAVGNGDLWGAGVTFIYQPKPLGLAHAVKTAKGFLKDEDFLMILGDNLFQMELGAIIKEFSDKAFNALILLHKSDNPSNYGVAVVDGEHVIRLVEKPKIPPSNLIITGIYLFDHSIFAAIDKTVPSARGELEITDAIQKLLDMGGSVAYKLTEGWWKDTGSLEDILEANRLVLGKSVPGSKAGQLTQSTTSPGSKAGQLTQSTTSPGSKAGQLTQSTTSLGSMAEQMTQSTTSLVSMAEQMTQSTTNPGCILEGQIQAGSNVSILNSALKGPIVLGSNISINGCRLGPFTAIGDHADLSCCEIEDSIILEGCTIRNISRTITSSLIGKGSTIEEFGRVSEGESVEISGKVSRDEVKKLCFFIGNDSKIIQQGS